MVTNAQYECRQRLTYFIVKFPREFLTFLLLCVDELRREFFLSSRRANETSSKRFEAIREVRRQRRGVHDDGESGNLWSGFASRG